MSDPTRITPAVRDLVLQGWRQVKRDLGWAVNDHLILDEPKSISQIRKAGLSHASKHLQNARGSFEPHTTMNAIDSLRSMSEEQVKSVLEEVLRSEGAGPPSDNNSSIAALEAL